MSKKRVYTGNIEKDCQEIALKHLRSTGNKVLRKARKYSKGPYSGAHGGMSIADSLSMVTARSTGQVAARVFSVLPIADVVEGGASAHKIEPHRPPWALKFFWLKAGGVVFFDHVNHPGMQGKRFLRRALIEVAKTDGYWIKYVRI